MKRCTKCNSLMPDDAVKCIKCGFEAARKPAAAPVAWAGKPGEKPGKIRGA